MENQKIKNWVALIFKDYENQYNKTPTFRDLIKDCIYIKGIDATEYLSKYIIKGWELNNYPTTDFNLVLKELLCSDRDYFYTEMIDYLTDCADNEIEIYTSNLSTSEPQEESFYQWRDRSIREAFTENKRFNVFVKNVYDEYISVFILLPNEFEVPKNEYMEDYFLKTDIPIHNFKNYTQKKFSSADVNKYEFSTLTATIISIDKNECLTLKIIE